MSRVSKVVDAARSHVPHGKPLAHKPDTPRPSALDLFAAAIPKAMDEARANQLTMIEKAKTLDEEWLKGANKVKDDCTMGIDDGGARNLHEVAKALEPWEQCPDVWKTKAMFFQWIRGQMRKAWSRHPVKVSYMHDHRERVPLGRKTTKNPQGIVWGCRCEHCHQLFRQTECEVDHIEEAGGFKDWENFDKWMHKLMHINWDSIRIVCKTCHRIISYAARMGITFEEAKLEKDVIAFTKTKTPNQHKVLALLGLPHGNAKERRASYKKHLQEQL